MTMHAHHPFQTLTAEHWQWIKLASREVAYGGGEEVWAAHAEVEGLGFLESGRLRVELPPGGRTASGFSPMVQPGEFFGEITLLEPGGTSAGLVSEEDSRVWFLPSDVLEAQLEADRDFAARFWLMIGRLAARRLRRATAEPSPDDSGGKPFTYEHKDGRYRFKVLDCREEILDACRLLHGIYIVEHGWQLTDDNPSGLEVRNDENGPYLWDGLTDISKWVACYFEGRLIACLRALSYPNFDLSKYVSIPPYLNHRRSIEYGRLAVHPDFRGCRHITLLLIRFFAETHWPEGYTLFTTGGVPVLAGLYKKLGFHQADVLPFRYNHTEGMPVELLYFDSSEMDRRETVMYKVTDRYFQ